METGGLKSSTLGVVSSVRGAIDDAFTRLNDLCGGAEEHLRHTPPYSDAWTVLEHLEHVSLVNHFLLLTIGKGVTTALRRALTRSLPPGASDLERLHPIADPDAFRWNSPGHMIPTGAQSAEEVRSLLAAQRGRCYELLGLMPSGEGRHCSIRMSVFELGKLDMYEWLYFLAQHGRWHLALLARREATRLECCAQFDDEEINHSICHRY